MTVYRFWNKLFSRNTTHLSRYLGDKSNRQSVLNNQEQAEKLLSEIKSKTSKMEVKGLVDATY